MSVESFDRELCTCSRFQSPLGDSKNGGVAGVGFFSDTRMREQRQTLCLLNYLGTLRAEPQLVTPMSPHQRQDKLTSSKLHPPRNF